jgi:hypothetical protein
LAIEAVASTSLQQTGSGKICVIAACAGTHMSRWLPLIAGIEDYARGEACIHQGRLPALPTSLSLGWPHTLILAEVHWERQPQLSWRTWRPADFGPMR